MMKQSAGLVLTTLNGFVIVGLEIVVVLCCFFIHYMSVPQCYRHAQASLSRQRISCLNSAGAWDSIWHTHIFCAFPTVSDSPSPSPGTPPSFFNRQDCTMETGMYVSPSAPPELVTMN